MNGSWTANEDRVLAHARALVDCPDRHSFVDEARQFLETAIGADASMWFPWDRHEHHFQGAVWPSIPHEVQQAYTSGLFREDPIYRWIECDPTAVSACVTTLQGLSARGWALSSDWQERCYQPCAISDVLCIAHVRNGQIVGNFALHRSQMARAFSSRDVRNARLLAHLLGSAYNALPDAQPPLHGIGVKECSPLTQRERTIATLASEGLSSKAIAKQTSLSRKTVDNHLSAIYSKLQLSGRTALAKYVWQHFGDDRRN